MRHKTLESKKEKQGTTCGKQGGKGVKIFWVEDTEARKQHGLPSTRLRLTEKQHARGQKCMHTWGAAVSTDHARLRRPTPQGPAQSRFSFTAPVFPLGRRFLKAGIMSQLPSFLCSGAGFNR